jgi:hypothetical protein
MALISLPAFAQSNPFKIVLVADPQAKARAQEFKTYILAKEPFKSLASEIEISISEMSVADLSCGNTIPTSPRIITCDRNKIARRLSEVGAHNALVFTSKGSGGAGGSIPVASTDYPLSTMLHEFLHTAGLQDEYHYSESEQTHYCNPPLKGANVALIKPNPAFANKQVALNKHGSEIPWNSYILQATPISTTQALGSPGTTTYQNSAGLYEGGHCSKKANLTEKIYRPYVNSIMKSLSDRPIDKLYSDRLVSYMEGRRGQKFQLATGTTLTPPPPPPCESIQKPEQSLPQEFKKFIQNMSDHI